MSVAEGGERAMRVLVVDDEESLCNVLSLMLASAGYDVTCVGDARAALEAHREGGVDLAILDVMMPGMDGFELCDALRRHDASLPILMLSAKSDIVDKRQGFRAGADDYLGKPFDEEELLLRVEALLRRRGRDASAAPDDAGNAGDGEPRRPRRDERSVLVVGSLSVDLVRTEVRVNGRLVQLTRKEYEIVRLLVRHPGKVFTKEDIIDEVWGSEFRDSSLSIPTYVRRIRMKLEKNPAEPQIIQTVFGFGYRLGG